MTRAEEKRGLRPSIDRRTLALLKQGDVTALDAVVVVFGARVRHYVCRLLTDVDDREQTAEDVAHDVFLQVFHSVRECRDPAAFPSWLFRITRNRALDVRRSRRTRGKILRSVASRVWGGMRRVDLSPPEALERMEFHEQFERALGALSEVQRTAFLLREGEGMSYQEIGDVLGVTEKTVSSRLHRAWMLLRQELANYLGYESERGEG